MIFDSLFLLAAATAQPPATSCATSSDVSAAAHSAQVSALAACRTVAAIVDLEATPAAEDLVRAAIFTIEGGGKAIVGSSGTGRIA